MNTSAVGKPPASGGEQILATGQAAPNGEHSVAPDRRMTAFVASPVLANSLLHLEGEQNLRQFKDLCLEVKKARPTSAGTVLAIL